MKQFFAAILLVCATSAFSQIDSMIGIITGDNYLEAGTDQDKNWGGKSFVRIKSNNQGVLMTNWDMSLIGFTPMAGSIILSNTATAGDTTLMSYNAVVAGITCDWFEGSGVTGSNDPNGSCYQYQTGTTPWPNSTPNANFAAQMDPVIYNGQKQELEFHVFPVSGQILQGLISGVYKGIVIFDQGSSGINNHFWSKESGNGPMLWCYSQEVHAEGKRTAAICNVAAFPNPFNPTTTLQFARPVSSAGIMIFNMSGKVVGNFNNITGSRFEWNTANLPSGTYIAKLTSNNQNQAIKLMLQK